MQLEVAKGYDQTYEHFDSPLMQRIRHEAYGEDIGQHSWVTADEIRGYLEFLCLASSDRFLDFGCGPCGPLTYIVQSTGCRGVGIDLSSAALRVGLVRANRMNLGALVELREADANSALPELPLFDALVCFDVILHLRDRRQVLENLRSQLRSGAKAVFTDAGILTGAASSSELAQRSVNGYTQFVPPGYNEAIFANCGFITKVTEDKTENVIRNATGRMRARANYKKELMEIEGIEKFEEHQRYLETVVELSARKSLSRYAYLVEAG